MKRNIEKKRCRGKEEIERNEGGEKEDTGKEGDLLSVKLTFQIPSVTYFSFGKERERERERNLSLPIHVSFPRMGDEKIRYRDTVILLSLSLS